MSEKVEVTQGTQRNLLDVATELTIFTAKYNAITDSGELKKLYSEYYALAKVLGGKSQSQLNQLIPDEILNKITR